MYSIQHKKYGKVSFRGDWNIHWPTRCLNVGEKMMTVTIPYMNLAVEVEGTSFTLPMLLSSWMGPDYIYCGRAGVNRFLLVKTWNAVAEFLLVEDYRVLRE